MDRESVYCFHLDTPLGLHRLDLFDIRLRVCVPRRRPEEEPRPQLRIRSFLIRGQGTLGKRFRGRPGPRREWTFIAEFTTAPVISFMCSRGDRTGVAMPTALADSPEFPSAPCGEKSS